MRLIYHIASRPEWERALGTGEYTVSTLGLSPAEVGFVHASTARQVAGVADAFYGGADDLVLLVIDEDQVGPQVRYESVPDRPDRFPHIYGPLNTDAVVRALPYAKGPDGRFPPPPATE
ncbi:DUF952 domain-containing protein [Spongiactinospora sp. 9N601]|uniref:DUF952 domain-containing protein n=1 Tax=Spongiactinospora sp. 9N601 TaxID=3375149 RepID=UPI00379DF242